jgi:hypothetical protein
MSAIAAHEGDSVDGRIIPECILWDTASGATWHGRSNFGPDGNRPHTQVKSHPAQMEGDIDAVVVGIGSGGTNGVVDLSRHLRLPPTASRGLAGIPPSRSAPPCRERAPKPWAPPSPDRSSGFGTAT